MIRVAVVDDEPLARSGVIVRLAGQRDVRVVGEYGDGESALSGLRTQRPDLVFIDVRMPGLSGLEVLAALPAAERPMAPCTRSTTCSSPSTTNASSRPCSARARPWRGARWRRRLRPIPPTRSNPQRG